MQDNVKKLLRRLFKEGRINEELLKEYDLTPTEIYDIMDNRVAVTLYDNVDSQTARTIKDAVRMVLGNDWKLSRSYRETREYDRCRLLIRLTEEEYDEICRIAEGKEV